MNKDLESMKFNLTQEMSLELIKFNELKKELNKLHNLDKNEKLLLKIKDIEKKMETSKNRFIKEFKLNNKKEIIEYLRIKDQK